MLPAKRVRLVGVPVALFLAAEQHTNDLLREIALMAAARPEVGTAFADVLSMAETYAHRPASVRDRIVESIGLAQRAGWDAVTVDVEADEAVADAAIAWEDLLRRFDTLSRDERLLTLPADDELVAYRSWYVQELVEQVRLGRGPVPWERARGLVLAGAH